MVPIRGSWTPFTDELDQINHFRTWGLIPPKSSKLRPVMVTDGYFGAPEPCKVVGYQGDDWAVIELEDGVHAIHGEHLAEIQPAAYQKLPFGACFADILSKYIVLDIETTGFQFHDDRIIEIAAISYEYGKPVDSYHTLINPGMLLPADIIRLTGISQTDVDSAPALEEVSPSFLAFIGDLPIIGHNVLSFDIPFLSAQLSTEFTNPVIDTLPMARKVFDLLPRHKLEYLNTVLQLNSAEAHRALNDVETTNALLWACLAPRKYDRNTYRAFLDHRTSSGSTETKKKTQRKWNPAEDQPSDTFKKPKRFEKIDIKSITPSCSCPDPASPLCGKVIVFTGELTIPREKAMQMAVDAGATLKTAVSRKTNYLVVGKQDIKIVGMDGMSTKEEAAHALNQSGKADIKIISEAEFLQLTPKEGASV